VEEAALRIRKELAEQGWDHGPLSVRARMLAAGYPAPSRATLARIFTRRGAVVPQPSKRPRSSWRRFTFAFVHECWQLDGTEVTLADESTACVFQLLDDHSRFIVGSWVDHAETSAGAVTVMAKAIAAHQVPMLLLTDNGMAMNPHRRGRTSALVAYARSLGVRAISSTPYHPQTMGKNERVHLTLKRWLAVRPAPADIDQLKSWLQEFDRAYNYQRPHQGIGLRTPASVLAADPRADPPEPPPPAPEALDGRGGTAPPIGVYPVQRGGYVHIKSKAIGLGTEYAFSTVRAIIEDNAIDVFDLDGTLLRSVALIAGQRSYPTGRPRSSKRKRPPENMTRNQQELSGPSET